MGSPVGAEHRAVEDLPGPGDPGLGSACHSIADPQVSIEARYSLLSHIGGPHDGGWGGHPHPSEWIGSRDGN